MAVGVALAEFVVVQTLAVVLVMALGARQVHLTLPRHVELLPCFKMFFGGAINVHQDGHAFGSTRHMQGDGQQLVRFR
jgi:hypothetical protein